MNPKSFRLKVSAFFLLFLLTFVQITNARPLRQFSNRQDDEKVKKLPPVNYIRSRAVDIKNVSIDLRFDWDKEQAYGATVVTLAPFKDLQKFNLDAASMIINSVTLANGMPLKFNYDKEKEQDNLEIMLDRQYKRGEDVHVKIDYRTNYVNKADADTAIGSFGRGLRFIKPTANEPNKPRQIWSQGETEFNRYWFPSYDTPNDFRTSELKATVEKPFMVISNGKLLEVKDNGDNSRTYHWKMDTPYTNYLTSIVVGEYTEVKNGEYQGVPIVAYGYPNEAKEVAETTKRVPAMVKFFSEKTGVKYPYAKYAQTMVEDFGGGMENISATTQIAEMIHDERELLDEDSDSLQSHELAHQWFGDYVTCRDWGQIWLNESFATYFQALWDEESKGKDFFLMNDVRSNQQQVLNTWNQGNRRPIVTKYYANKDAMFDNYAYPGGGAVLHILRKHLGDELFFKSLNHYLTTNAHQPVQTEQLRIAIEEATGQSMDWFFDQWLYKMGHPVFEVTKSYDSAKKQLTLNVKQTQKVDPNNEFPQVEFFRTFVDIEIDDNVQRVWIEPKAENTFTFSSAAEPKLVNFDYEGTLLKELKFDKSVDELVYQMTNDKDILGRRWAMSELSKTAKNSQTSATDKNKILAAFNAKIANDSSWLIRRAAIAEISQIVSPQQMNPLAEKAAVKLDEATVQVLLKAAKDENSLVRADAIELLGATKDTKYTDLYLSALNDRSYSMIENAAVALGETKNAKAYDAFVKLTNTPSWKGRIAAAGFRGLAALEDKRGLEFALKTATDKTQPANVRGAALETIAATSKGDKRAFPLIFDSFKQALDANNFNGLSNSVQAIIKLADPRGQEAFDMLKEKFKNQPQILNFATFLESQFKAALPKQ
ncbi:MAG: HEAT repeat domain-containing protein [Acidobacteria bacterium]|nr:HEAT repeat domain-containing protein [Acidobacteriota bacterium]